ncbi:hypothetical protein EDD85DRAFT_956187 [Armillaria nabsnona]|nr:hypothetical protein EDD85DRAFT_956187 [Armillaria nabsnona]
MTGSGSRASLTPPTTCSTMTMPLPSSLTPINGKITHAEVVPGTYYVVLPDDGAEDGDLHGAIIRCQAWLTHSATHAIIYTNADNPDIGFIMFIGVGMVEVSACDLSVKVDDKVSTGDELEMFHFRGSSHVLIFGPKVAVTFMNAEFIRQPM